MLSSILYLKGREYKINNGKSISFWLDVWLDDQPLCTRYPVLYELSMDKNCYVYEMTNAEWVIRFRIRLQGILREQWYQLAARLNRVSLNEEKDQPIWKWTTSKRFTVKSVYASLTKTDSGPAHDSLEVKVA
jgi:hypothetical protein